MCKIPRCSNPAVAHGLCAKHYMRQRRHGDPTVTHPPGVDLDAWRKKVATLERELARVQNTAKPSAPCAACAAKDREIERLTAQLNGQQNPGPAENERLKADNERLKTENAGLRKQAAAANGPSPLPRTAEELAQAKARAAEQRKADLAAKRAAKRAANPEIPDEKTKEEYERQIKSLRTQLRKKTEMYEWAKSRFFLGTTDNIVFASAADRKFALAHFHPDRFKREKLGQAKRVFQLLNNIPVMDR